MAEMSPEKFSQVKEVFLAVCNRPPAERDKAVDELCQSDADLAAEVRSLLRSHEKAQDITQTVELSRDTVGATSSSPLQRAAAAAAGSSSAKRTGKGTDSHRGDTFRGRFAPGTV